MSGLMLTFHANPKHLAATAPKSTPTTTQETTQEKIMAILRKAPTLTQRKLAEQIGISDNGIKYHLTRLKADGMIRHVGSTKAGRWEVLK